MQELTYPATGQWEYVTPQSTFIPMFQFPPQPKTVDSTQEDLLRLLFGEHWQVVQEALRKAERKEVQP